MQDLGDLVRQYAQKSGTDTDTFLREVYDGVQEVVEREWADEKQRLEAPADEEAPETNWIVEVYEGGKLVAEDAYESREEAAEAARDWNRTHGEPGERARLYQATAEGETPNKVAPPQLPARFTYFTGTAHDERTLEAAERRNDLGVVVTPKTQEYIERHGPFPSIMVDNGAFQGSGFNGKRFLGTLDRIEANPDAKKKVYFVIAPDTPFHAKETLEQFDEWADEIHARGLPVALAAQNGMEDMIDQLPWDKMDVLFIGGDTNWKTGKFDNPEQKKKFRALLERAHDEGIPIHMGRVNTEFRSEIAHWNLGMQSADGTGIKAHPVEQLKVVEQFLDRWNDPSGRYWGGYDDTISSAAEEDTRQLEAYTGNNEEFVRALVAEVEGRLPDYDAAHPGTVKKLERALAKAKKWLASLDKPKPERNRKRTGSEPEANRKETGSEPEAEPEDEGPQVDLTEKSREEVQAEQESEDASFVRYVSPIKGKPHPSPLVETRVMATTEAPPITYQPNLPEDTAISAPQLETPARAGQMHEQFNEDGQRLGFLNGDGTGVGKGRQAAAVAWDNWRQGRRKIIWVSANQTLINDAMRDLEGIGKTLRPGSPEAKSHRELVNAVPKSKSGAPQSFSDTYSASEKVPDKPGLHFVTYGTLIAKAKGERGQTRQQQLENWLKGKGEDGEGAVIIFDEGHKAKNAVPTTPDGARRGQSSQTGDAVVNIQDALPKARVLYMSATSATDINNLGYLTRLGLWGKGTAFPNGFGQFMTEVGRSGVAGMELIAREMKALGRYLSRSISYKGVNFEEKTHNLSDDQKDAYDTAARAWQELFNSAQQQITDNNGDRDARTRFGTAFWTAHQRFFRTLLTAMKAPTVIDMAEKALRDNQSVVISLIGTGQAQQDRVFQRTAAEQEEEPDFSPKEILKSLIEEYYPTVLYEEVEDESGNIRRVPVTETDPETGATIYVQNPAAIEKRDELIRGLDKLMLPESPLDYMINQFGREKVAELTGRTKYPFYNEKTGKIEPRSRAPEGVAQGDVNKYEMDQFQGGKKRIAIISKAAGTGISLQADKDAKNQQKRLHIVLELSWSADDQMQSFGRTHRSNQVQPPEYVIVSTDLGGEKRFSSTIARRLESLGALTKGQREATGGGGSDLLSKYNYETDEGKAATRRFYENLQRRQAVPDSDLSPEEILLRMGVGREEEDDHGNKTGRILVSGQDKQNVTRLLNRILNLETKDQNAVYDYFNGLFHDIIADAREAGTLDEGVNRVEGDEVHMLDQREIARDQKTGAKTYRYHIQSVWKNKPVSAEKAQSYSGGHVWVNKESGQMILAQKTSVGRTDAQGRTVPVYRFFIPEHRRGDHWWRIDETELNENYRRYVDPRTIDQRDRLRESRRHYETSYNAAVQSKDDWGIRYYKQELDNVEKALKQANEQVRAQQAQQWEEWDQRAEGAKKGTSTHDQHMIGGSVLRVWDHIKEVVGSGRRLDVKIAYPEEGGSYAGVVLPKGQIDRIERQLGTGEGPRADGQTVFDSVMQSGETVRLTGGIRLESGRVLGNKVVRIYAPQDVTPTLRDMGVRSERFGPMGWTYYVPADPAISVPILNRLVERYPVDDRRGEAGGISPDLFLPWRWLKKDDKPKSPRVNFLSDEVEERVQKSSHEDEPTVRDRLAKIWDTIKSQGRIYEHLPRKEYGRLIFELKRLERSAGVASSQTIRHLLGITKGMDSNQYDLFRKKVIVDDLLESLNDWEEKGLIPEDQQDSFELAFGLTPETLRQEHEHITNEFEKDPQLVAALEKRQQIWAQVRREYLEDMESAGVNLDERMKRENYYRHRVLDHLRETTGLGTGQKLRTPTGRSFTKKRGINALDYSTDYITSEYEVMAQMLADAGKARTISWLKNSEHNILGKLKEKARAHNKAAVMPYFERMAEDYNNQPLPMNSDSPREPLTGEDMFRRTLNRKQAIAIDEIGRMAAEGELPDDNGRWTEFIEELGDAWQAGKIDLDDDEDRQRVQVHMPTLLRYANWVLQSEHGGEAKMPAATLFKGIREKREEMKRIAKDEYVDPRDHEALTKAFAPEGYRLWYPREGNVFYMAHTIPERIAMQIMEAAGKEVGVSEEDMRKVMAVGQKHTPMVLPDAVADTLDKLKGPHDTALTTKLRHDALKLWKKWQLLSPYRVAKYNLRNLSGDMEATFAGNPRAFRKVGESTRDLWRYFTKGEISENLQEWFDHGGWQSVEQVYELGELKNVKELDRLMRTSEQRGHPAKKAVSPANWWKKYFNAAQIGTNAREAVLRYANFLEYADQIEKEGKPRNYGASIPSEVEGLEDTHDKAYKLSNDLLGAYDEVSVMGQQIRRNAMPFWSFQELNVRRAWRLFRNAARDQKLAGAVGRRLLGKAVARSPYLAFRVGSFYLMANGMRFLLDAINRFGFPDEEDDLREDVRKRPHLILGRNRDGSVRYFSRLGNIPDLLEWADPEDMNREWKDYLNGRINIGQAIGNMLLYGPVEKAIVSGPPGARMGYELATGQSLYPSLRRPRPIYDKAQYVADSLAVGDLYRRAAGKAMPQSRGFLRSVGNLASYEADPAEGDFYDQYAAKNRFIEETLGKGGGSSGGSRMPLRTAALREMKTALRKGDVDAFSRYLEEYVATGGTSEGLKNSIRQLHPLSGLNTAEKRQYYNQLDAEGRRQLARAIGYWQQVFASQRLREFMAEGSSRLRAKRAAAGR